MIRIGIIGDFDSQHHTHVAIDHALDHSAAAMDADIMADWIPTPEVTDELLSEYDGLWAAPASPYKSFDGMLRGIAYARSGMVPFTGT